MVILQIVILLLMGLLIYSPVLLTEAPSNPDAQFIWMFLKSYSGPFEYFQNLVSLNTLDFQPMRDLSLWIDMKIFDLTGVNLLVIQNILLWVSFSYVSSLVLQKYFDLNERAKVLLATSFMAYPLFTQSVAWGMARKHLLSVLFIQIATYIWIQDKISVRRAVLVCSLYVLSILSQPISLLWPVWAILYSMLLKPDTLKLRLKTIISLSLLMILFTGINFAYYQFSPTFLRFYGLKTNELFELSDKILAIGHYCFQIFFPYLLGFRYSLGNWSTLVGLAFLVMFSFFLIKFKTKRKEIVVWSFYTFLPLMIILAKSSMLYDTYLLLPAFGVVALLIPAFRKINLPNEAWIVVIFIWTGFSFYNVQGWADEILLTKRSFERWPNCTSAYDYLKTSFENDRPQGNQEARLFLINHECTGHVSDPLNLQSYMLFYGDDIPIDERIKHLSRLAKQGVFPAMVFAAIKVQKYGSAENEIENMLERFQHVKYRDEYIPIVAKILYPYCQKNANVKCLLFLKRFSKKKDSFFYK